jgi:hypothetical protein
LAWQTAIQQFGRKPVRAEIRQAPFCQLFHLGKDPTETTNLAEKNPEIVQRLGQILDLGIQNGRTTQGPVLANDRIFNPNNDVPKFVWK